MKKFEQTRNILVSVDVQNDFVDGSLAVPDGESVVEPLNRTARALRHAGGVVLLTRDWHPAETPHFADYGGLWPAHCVAETYGAEFHPRLDVQPSDITLSKGMEQTDGYSGWEGVTADQSSLETFIAPANQQEKVRVFIGGLATDYCVQATALDITKNFADNDRVVTYLLRDAVRGVNIQPGDSDTAIEAMEAAGVAIIDSRKAIELLQGVA